MEGAGKASHMFAPQYALCLERPKSSQFHDHVQCPLVGTLNKIRAQGEIKPLTFELGGMLVRSDEKVDLDVSKEVRMLKETVKSLADRLKKLEKTSQVPAAGNQASSGGGKRKQQMLGGDQPKPKKVKTVDGGKQGGGGNQVASGSGLGGSKGKGKQRE